MTRFENQVMALAGMFQAAVVIDDLAFKGNTDDQAFETCFNSLFTFDAASPQEVFGGVAGLGRGFHALDDYLGGELRNNSRNIAHYVLSMMKIALQVTRNRDLSATLFERLQSIEKRRHEFDMSRSAVVLKIDGLYQDSISHLKPRIMVAGEQNHLMNTDNAARVRTLLLAGVRSAVLWRQLGGSKWKLLFGRRRYIAVAKKILQDN